MRSKYNTVLNQLETDLYVDGFARWEVNTLLSTMVDLTTDHEVERALVVMVKQLVERARERQALGAFTTAYVAMMAKD